MLVLTRKYQEKIRIGENITITVLRMKGKAVRLGIEAPDSVPVLRGELSFTIDADGEASPTLTAETAGGSSARGGHSVARAAGMTKQWTQSKPDAARGSAHESGTKVGFTRVPRDQVAEILPKLAAGTAPLRRMMDQRS